MVMTKASAVAIHLANMGQAEAEQVTQAIKDNFDSLGAMLVQARDRKAYRALGYRSFETYCKTEFGKSVSSAYQLIEDAKVISELEAKIAENYGEEVTLKFPASHLRPLREISGIDDKLKAIEYANKLAETENRKATKKDLEIAVFQVTGKRSEDFKAAIHSLGFSKGVAVEVIKSLKRDRGIVTKVDNSGKIYVEFYYGGNTPLPFDATDLRLLGDAEKPIKPASDDTLSKGDIVKIFAKGLEGKTGEVFIWKPGKQGLVLVENDTLPTDIAYAEMELVKPEKKDSNWETDSSWNTAEQTYHYFQKEDRIYSDKWPAGLTLTPSSHELSPIEFMANWEEKFAEQLLQLFLGASPEPLSQKSLGISFAQTIDELISGKKTQTRRAWQDDYAKNFIRYFDENIPIPALNKGRHRGGHELGFIRLTQRPYQQYLSEMTAIDLQEEGAMVATTQEFIDTFFEGQNKLVWVLHFEFLPSRSDAEILQENQQLRQQLLEAETVIQSMVTASKFSSPGDTAAHSDFLVENIAKNSAPGDTAAHSDFLVENIAKNSAPGDATEHADSWKELLEANYFNHTFYDIDEFEAYDRNKDFKGHWRGWNIFFHNEGLTSISLMNMNNDKKELFCRCTEVFPIDGDEDEIIDSVKKIINQVEDFCPGQLSLFPVPLNKVHEIEKKLPPEEILERLEMERAKANDRIADNAFKKNHPTGTNNKHIKKQREQLDKDTENQYAKLKDLEKFSQFRVGQTICHKRDVLILGKIIKLEFSQGGMPLLWIKFFRDGELEKTPTSELVSMVFTVDT